MSAFTKIRTARALASCAAFAISQSCSSEPAESASPAADVRHEPAHPAGIESAPFSVSEPPRPATPATATLGETRLVYSHVDVVVNEASVTTLVSDVVVNDTEAEVAFRYDFPLPHDARITRFAHWIDGARVEAVAKDRAAARGDFESAAAKGDSAALSESNGTSRFSIELSPLAAGATRRVEIEYVQNVDSFGPVRSYTFPAAHSERRGDPILDIEVDIHADSDLALLESLNHPDARVVNLTPERARVLLQQSGAPLGDDLSIRWKVKADPLQLSARVASGPDGQPGYAEVLFSFNQDTTETRGPSRDFVFVLDTSLSMAGEAMSQARSFVEHASAHLRDDDRVALVTFDDELQSWDGLEPATTETRNRLLDAVSKRRAGGLSNVEAAIDRSAELIRAANNPIVVFFSDGQSTLGSDLDTLQPGASAKDFERAKVVVAVTNYPSRQPVFERLFPGASVRFVPSGEAGQRVVKELAQLAAAPTIEEVSLQIEGMQTEQRHGALPTRLPLGEQLRIVGRLEAVSLHATVSGVLHGKKISFAATATLDAGAGEASTLPLQWARARIADLELEVSRSHDAQKRSEAIELAKSFGLVSTFTSLVATDSLSPDRVAPGDPEIRIRAPRSSSEVYAVLPWGERVECSWLEHEAVWFGRFLVPRSVGDGLYRARVFTTSQGLTELRGSLAFAVDSKPPRFDLDVRREGAKLVISATPQRDVFDRRGDTIRFDLVDVKRVSVQLAGRIFELLRDRDDRWTASIPLALAKRLLDGVPELRLVATDYAQNSAVTSGFIRHTDGEFSFTPRTAPADSEGNADDEASVAAHTTSEPSSQPAFYGECRFGKSRRLQALRTNRGVQVERFESFLRVDGELLNPCNGLPAAHPTAIAAFGDGYAVGFRSGAVYAQNSDSPLAFRQLFEANGSSVTALLSSALPGNESSGDPGRTALWVGTTNQGLWMLSSSGAAPVKLRAKSRHVTALAADEHSLLVGVGPRGVWRLDPATLESTRSSSASAGCFVRRAGKLAAVSPGAGCQDTTSAGQLPSSHVTALHVFGDRLIVGSFDQGAFSIDKQQRVSSIDDAPRFINAITATAQSLWFATPTGLFLHRSGTTRPVPLPLDARHVNGMTVAKDGTLWLATERGVLGRRDDRWLSPGVQGLPSRLTYAVAESHDGSLWVGTAAGAARLVPSERLHFSIEAGTLPHRWVTALLPYGNEMLVGTYSGGVTRLNASAAATTNDNLWINPHGLSLHGDQVFAATLGDGLWTWPTSDPRRARRISGLPSDDVTAVAEFAGRLWVGTRGGLSILPVESVSGVNRARPRP